MFQDTRAKLLWVLWAALCVVIVAAFRWAPLAQDFLGESSRILFFHVPMAWTSSVAFIAAGIASARYLFGGRDLRHDRSALAAVELGMVFCILATATGAMWAKTMWGAFWNWDPRQSSIAMVLVYYGAYLALRSSIQDPEKKRRLAAAYGVLGLVIAPFLFYVAPRMAAFSLHPQPVINADMEMGVESRMLTVLLTSSLLFMTVYFWIHNLQTRLLALSDARELELDEGGAAR